MPDILYTSSQYVEKLWCLKQGLVIDGQKHGGM